MQYKEISDEELRRRQGDYHFNIRLIQHELDRRARERKKSKKSKD